MEGPYRDLGDGFVRLTGVEGVRRAPSHIDSVEEAFVELLRNAQQAGANNIYVSTVLRARRYRTLTVIDDGRGIPEAYKDLIFELGVTDKHLSPAPPRAVVPDQHKTAKKSNGGGLSLYHIKNTAVQARVVSTVNPTSIQATFDTRTLPEKATQSGTRPSGTNLPATAQRFLTDNAAANLTLFYGSPAAIMTSLIENRITHSNSSATGLASGYAEQGKRLGFDISLRTVQRIVRGEIEAAKAIKGGRTTRGTGIDKAVGEDSGFLGRPRLELGREEISGIQAILGEAARSRYLEVGEVKAEVRPGEIILRSYVYEPEEEYE